MSEVDLVKTFGAIFAIMNPFLNLPIFLGLTADRTQAEQRLLAVKVTFYCAIMCAVLLVAGQAIIAFFGISVDQFRVAGGIVLAHIAWSMLNGGGFPAHHGSVHEQAAMEGLDALAFYPITFPLIVGPGTIATLIIFAGHAHTAWAVGAIGAIVAAILLIMFVVLFFAAQIGRVLSETMRTITTRLMGMILLAIAIDMIVAGTKVLLPGLAH